MQRQQLGNISGFFNNLRLNQKIQLSLMLIILPLFVLFAVIFYLIFIFAALNGYFFIAFANSAP